MIGAYLSYVESLNPAAHAHFGWEVDHEARRFVEPRAPGTLGRGRRHFGRHRVAGGGGPVEEDDVEGGKPGGGVGNKQQGGQAPLPKWKWFGADWSSFGYVANVIQLYGASIL